MTFTHYNKLYILHTLNYRKNPAERPDLATLMGHPWLRGVEQVLALHLPRALSNYVRPVLIHTLYLCPLSASTHCTSHILPSPLFQDTTDVAKWVQEVIRLRHPV